MGFSDQSETSAPSLVLVLLTLALGAAVGIGAAAMLLARKDRAQPEDPDTPLFI